MTDDGPQTPLAFGSAEANLLVPCRAAVACARWRGGARRTARDAHEIARLSLKGQAGEAAIFAITAERLRHFAHEWR